MEKENKLFEENPIVGGYNLSVRDDWSYKIKKVNITAKEKDQYIKEFANQMLTYNEFFYWWKNLKKRVGVNFNKVA